MIVSNYGFFATSFTPEMCQQYYLLAPAFKGLFSQYCQDSIDHFVVMQIMVSQVILGVRYVLLIFMYYGPYKVMHRYGIGHLISQKEIGALEFLYCCYTSSHLQ
jgi:hypothetical protein